MNSSQRRNNRCNESLEKEDVIVLVGDSQLDGNMEFELECYKWKWKGTYDWTHTSVSIENLRNREQHEEKQEMQTECMNRENEHIYEKEKVLADRLEKAMETVGES